jgi:hypothetical protein
VVVVEVPEGATKLLLCFDLLYFAKVEDGWLPDYFGRI